MATRKIQPVLTRSFGHWTESSRPLRAKRLNSSSLTGCCAIGVQRGIEIISEATRHIPDELLGIVPSVPWKRIRGIGNVLRHEYHRIADRIIWNVVTDELPALKAAVDRISALVATPGGEQSS